MTRTLLRFVATGLVCAVFAACSGSDGGTDPEPMPTPEICPENRWPPCPEEPDPRERGFLPGAIAPVTVAEDQFGESVALRQFRGATVVMSLGATWCGPCRDDASVYQETRAYLEAGAEGELWMIEVLADAGDPANPRHVAWADAYSIDEPVLGGPNVGNVVFAYAAASYPTKIVIDYEGRVVGRVYGSGQWEQILAWVVEADRRRSRSN